MKLDIKVTHEFPASRVLAGLHDPDRMPEAMQLKPHSLVIQTSRPEVSLVVDVVSVCTGGDLSGYTIGQMLRAIADDVEAADDKVNPRVAAEASEFMRRNPL